MPQVSHAAFDDACLRSNEVLRCIDACLRSSSRFVHAEALLCVQELAPKSARARTHFLAPGGPTIEALSLLASQALLSPTDVSARGMQHTLAAVLLLLCGLPDADDVLDTLADAVQDLLTGAMDECVIRQCCQSMEQLSERAHCYPQPEWTQATCARLAAMTVLSIYSVACFATRAAVALVTNSRDAAEHFSALNMPQMLASSLVISTDSLLLHQYLELLARLASMTGTSRVIMDIHRACIMPAVITIVRRDTWRRHLHPFMVLAMLFSEQLSLFVPRMEWTSDLINVMLEMHPTGVPELDKLAHQCMLDYEASLTMPYNDEADSAPAYPKKLADALQSLRNWLSEQAWQLASEASPMQSQRTSLQGRALSLQGHWQGPTPQFVGRRGRLTADMGQQTEPLGTCIARQPWHSVEGAPLTQITELADVSPPGRRSGDSSRGGVAQGVEPLAGRACCVGDSQDGSSDHAAAQPMQEVAMRARRLILAKSRKQQSASLTRSAGASVRSLAVNDSGKTDVSWNIEVPDCGSLLCTPSIPPVASAQSSAPVSHAGSEHAGPSERALVQNAARAGAGVQHETISVRRTVQRGVSLSADKAVAVSLVLSPGSAERSSVKLRLNLR